MEPESLKQLTAKYDSLIEELNKYHKIYSDLAEQSKEAGKGCIGYLDDRPDLKHGHDLVYMLESVLFSLHIVIDGNEDKDGECGVKCIGCGASYDKKSKRWSCQVTCECK